MTFISILIASQLLTLSCTETYERVSRADANPDFYLRQSPTTDPREFAYLFENLPEQNDRVCDLIKKQLIHPLEVGRYGNAIPEDRHFEDTLYESVSGMLSGLIKYDSSGIAMHRKPPNRLIVACFHHSLMLASILRERNTPVRIRFGFAPYIGRMAGKDVNISHVVCEVWNDEESRWIYIDPDRNMVDFPPRDFICGSEAWLRYRRGDIDIDKYRSAFFVKERSILDMLRLDLLYALREEIMYWSENGAPDIPKIEDLSRGELRALDRIAELMKHAGSHREELKRLKDGVAFLR